MRHDLQVIIVLDRVNCEREGCQRKVRKKYNKCMQHMTKFYARKDGEEGIYLCAAILCLHGYAPNGLNRRDQPSGGRMSFV